MISRRKFWLSGIAVLVAILGSLPLSAQEPVERQEVVVIDDTYLDSPRTLSLPWHYSPGDNPESAAPDLDDSGWMLVLPSLTEIGEDAELWPGIGWFRRRFRATEQFGTALGIYVAQAGASEVYLDGQLVAEFGTVSDDPSVERTHLPQYAASITIQPGVEHVLAIRYSNVTGNVFRRDFRGFEFSLGGMEALSAMGIQIIRQYTAFMSFAIGLFSAFAVLHLLLFAFQPKLTENLYLAIFAGSMVGLLLGETQAGAVSDLANALVFFKWSVTGAVMMALFALLVELKVFKRRIGPFFFVLAAIGLAVLVGVWTQTAIANYAPAVIFIVLVLLATIWQAILAMVDGVPDAWVIGLGFLVMALSIFATILRELGWLEISHWLTAVVGVGAVALAFSVFLTRRVARTNRQLESKLAEIADLTQKTIEQERWAAREEAERRVLEADNARKTAELEEARQLQLAMLPHSVPELDHFDLAFHMSTANEVGGDYYDFSTNGDGSCTLVVGDATGHGLHAGMVVGAAKSLFQTCSHEARLATVLERIAMGLAAMHRREASMAMLLVRFNAHRLHIASAGMPPLLIWRSASREIDEILLPSVPLGTLSRTEYKEADIDLQQGDAALIMTDGLAEVTNPDGDLLGYERAAELFAEVAHLAPSDAIDRLLELAAEYHAGTPLQDDMTLVVLRARS